MSLINEALKRAKQAHQESAPLQAPVPALRPVEPSQHAAGRGSGLALPVGLGLFAVVGIILCFLLWNRQSAPETASPAPTPVAAKTLSAEPADLSKSPAPVIAATAPAAPTAPTVAHQEVVAANADHPGVIPPGSSAAGTNQTAVPAANSDANHLSSEQTAPPAPPPLRLQSIVFNPKHPSAMINGRVVFVGDRIRDLRVASIHSGDVVLSGPGRTNVLSLEP